MNIWLSIIGIGGSLLTFAIRGFRRRPGDSDAPYVDGHQPEGTDPNADAPEQSEHTEHTEHTEQPARTEQPDHDQESDHESL